MKKSGQIEGINKSKALEFCGTEEIHNQMLEEFMLAAGERLQNLNKALLLKDMNAYRLEAHSVKSTAKMIGALELSWKAEELEHVARLGELERVQQQHTAFMGMIEIMIDRISESFDADSMADMIDEYEEAEAAQLEKEREGEPDEKAHILVVDDDGMALKSMLLLLSDLYHVSVVSSAQSAFTSIHEEKPDLILLDYEMPGLNGRAVLRLLHANPETKDIPVVMLTAVTDKERVREIIEMQPDGYLLKSVGKAVMVKKIEEILNQKRD